MMINLLSLISYFFYGAILTYLVWGFVVAMEVNLAMADSDKAIEWIKKHYSYKGLYAEVLLFYPMIVLGYFFLEYLPHLIDKSIPLSFFDLDSLFSKLFS